MLQCITPYELSNLKADRLHGIQNWENYSISKKLLADDFACV